MEIEIIILSTSSIQFMLKSGFVQSDKHPINDLLGAASEK